MQIRFRAKRQDGMTRWNTDGFTDGHTAYSVPVFTESHVITPRADRDTRELLMFQAVNRDIAKSRTESLLKANGLDPYRIFEEDAVNHPGTVQIQPIGKGFMADITLTLSTRRPAA